MAHAANSFLAAEPIQLGRALVPVRNEIITVTHQDCIVAQVEQQRLFEQGLLPLPSFRYVTSDFRCPNDSSRGIFHRRYRKGEMNSDAVLAQTDSFIMIYAFSALESLKNCRFLVQ